MDKDQIDSDRSTPTNDIEAAAEPLVPSQHDPGGGGHHHGPRQAEIVAFLPSKQSLERTKTIDPSRHTLKHRKSTKAAQRRSNVVVDGDTLRRVESIYPEDTVDMGSESETWRRLEAVKALTSSLDVKRQTRDQLKNTTTVKLTGYEKWKHQQKKSWKRTKKHMNEFFANFEVWRSSFKVIDGNFGSSVVAYFRFVKWLFFLNLFTTLLVLGAIVLPQGIMSPKSFEDSIDLNTNGTVNWYQEEALNCTDRYLVKVDSTLNQGATQSIIDFFQGTGWMEHTVLFAGYYFNKTYYWNENETRFYNMPLAYILVPLVYLLITLILMVDSTSTGVKETLVTQGDRFYRSCNKVFCGWDYSLAQEKAAYLKHNNLYREYINDLAEERREKERENMSNSRKVGIFVIRLIVWTVVIAIWCGAFYLIVMVVGTWTPELLNNPDVISSRGLTLIVEYLPSLTMTGLNFVFPPFFEKIVVIEDYAPETEIKITIARTVILRLASIGVLMFTLVDQITSCEASNVVCGVCDNIKNGCWETYIGQEFYKLVILDFIVVCGVVFFVEFPRKLIVRKFIEKSKIIKLVGYQEFLIPKNVIEIVYSQTICWIGAFFSPLIPAITLVKFFVFFYSKKLSLLYNCIPASRPYKASKSSYFFLIILMFSFALGLIFIAFCIGRIHPSQGCGPFRVYSHDDFYMFSVVSIAVNNVSSVVQEILRIITHWITYIILLILLILMIYYYQAIASGNKRKVELLKEQLALEGKDKQFLLSRVNEALKKGELHGRS